MNFNDLLNYPINQHIFKHIFDVIDKNDLITYFNKYYDEIMEKK